MSSELLLLLTVDALTIGSLYVLIALGYVLIYSILGIFHMVHGDVVIIGGLTAALVLDKFGVGLRSDGPPPLPQLAVATVVAVVVCGLLSLAIEVGVYRRIRSRSPLTPLLAALGLSLIIENVLLLATSKQPILFPPAAIPDGAVSVAGFDVRVLSLLEIFAAVLVLGAVTWYIRSTRLGVAMRAIAQDADAVRMIGVPERRLTAVGFLIAGGIAGLAGVLFAMYVGSLKWSMGLTLGIKGFSAALVGGLGSVAGAGVGGYLLGITEVFATGIRIGDYHIDSSWRDAISFAVVIVVLVLRPQGILGRGGPTWRVRN